MSQPEQQATQVIRVFEQPPDAISAYSEFAQVLGTGAEVTIQFYETIPGPPGAAGHPEMVRTRLRATIMLSPAHAVNIGQLLQQQVAGPTQISPTEDAPPEGQG